MKINILVKIKNFYKGKIIQIYIMGKLEFWEVSWEIVQVLDFFFSQKVETEKQNH